MLGLAIGLAWAPLLNWLKRRARVTAADLAEHRPEVSEQLQVTVDLLRAAAVVVGPYDEVLHSNPQARSIGLVRGNRVAPEELLELVRDVRQRGQAIGTMLKLKREPGTPVMELALRVSAMAGGIVLVIADDRSAHLRTDEIKRDFVANVSHELKTPVGAIRVLAEAVEQAADDPQAVQRFASRMIGEADRLAELINQIIELSRLQSDDPLYQPKVVAVDDVLQMAITQCRELAAAHSIAIRVGGTTGLQVLGDERQLASAVINLIDNAIAYSDPGARVAVSARACTDDEDDWVEISVADNGIGINAEDLERIFERFYRVDYARSRSQGGTGLGLSIVKHTIGAHGGTVNVWSKVGQGSTFTLRLPAYEVLNEEDEVAPATPLATGGNP